MTEKQTVLIVDDTPENIDVLDGILKEDYTIKAALDGERALKIASGKKPPDLILLDIMMPGTDGYQVCRQLRQNKATSNIPIIFVTAKKEAADEARGFDAGAVDYITKPVKPAVVKARVQTHIELKRHRDQMEALAEARAKQLVHAERLSTMGLLSAGVAHEINNPLTYIHSYAAFIEEDLEALRTLLAQAVAPSHPQREPIDRILLGFEESVSEIAKGSRRIASLVKSMKHLSRRDDRTKAGVDMNRCIRNALTLCRFSLKPLRIHLDLDKGLPPITGNEQQIEQVLINLLQNAADALEKAASPEIHLTAKADEGHIHITVSDNGPGIDADKLPLIWEAFYTTKPAGKGTGLGLSISRGIIEEHGGRIRARNNAPSGACFTIKLPLGDLPDR